MKRKRRKESEFIYGSTCPGEDHLFVNSFLGDHRQCPRYLKVHGALFQAASSAQGSQHTLVQGKVIFQCSERTQGSVKAQKELQVARFVFGQTNRQPCVLQSRQFTSDELNKFLPQWTRPNQTTKQNLSSSFSPILPTWNCLSLNLGKCLGTAYWHRSKSWQAVCQQLNSWNCCRQVLKPAPRFCFVY